jgi:curved DNA-binding protein CbpA
MPRAPFDPATDYYQLLGVAASASAEQIQVAYRRLAKAYHPDLNAGSAVAAARMARLNVAKSVLLDPHMRARYDQLRAARVRPAAQVAAAAGHRAAAAPVAAATYPHVAPAQTPTYRTSAHRVAPKPPRRSNFDRGTGLLLLFIVPLLGALLLYVIEAVQLAGQPLRQPPSDLALSASGRPSARSTADTVFLMLHGQPPSQQLAETANRLILSRRDGTPEGELLRAVGRHLLQAGRDRDAAAWQSAIAEVCLLAARC